MPTYKVENTLENDIRNVIKDIKDVDLPNHADENFVLATNDYIRMILLELYEPDIVKKYLYDEILSQIVYQEFNSQLYDNPYRFVESEKDKKALSKQVKKLANIPQMEQRSEEWYDYRNGRITASDFSSIFGKNAFKSRQQLLREKIDPSSINYVSNDTVLHGTRLEDAICQMYQCIENTEVTEFGCLAHPTIGHLGASPDGIDKKGVMLEIKCPPKRVIKGIPPIYYWYQMQLQLEVAELNKCDYMECKIDIITKDEFQELLKNEHVHREEAGCFIECWNYKQKKLIHDYFPVGNNLTAVNAWETTYLDALENNEELDYRNTLYWQAKTVAQISIYRDPRWFARCRHEVSDFWDKVIEGRELLAKRLTNEENNDDTKSITSKTSAISSKSTRSTRTKKSVCLIASDSDEE